MAGKEKQASDSLDRPALAADQAAVIVGRNANRELDGLAAVARFVNLDRVRVTHERLNDFFDRCFHFIEPSDRACVETASDSWP